MLRKFTLLTTLLLSNFIILEAYNPINVKKIDPQLISNFESNHINSCLISLENEILLRSNFINWTKNEKGQYVYEQLKTQAENSQFRILNYLREHSISHQSFLIVNTIRADLNKKQLDELAGFPEVMQISADPTVKLVQYKMIRSTNQKMDPTPEWGIQMIRADSVWKLGISGEGVVIAGQDTGYEWDHDVLKLKYRGWDAALDTADHNYNWHDAIREINPMHGDSTLDAFHNPCGLDLSEPCDDNNHGTHTMGSMVGSDSLNAVGVAPGAKWIACRNMERGYGTPSTYLESLEWFLAPTDLDGKNPRPDLAPHVINNSWSCPTNEGCNEMNWHILQTAIKNLKAAGIVFVASAGNDGRDGCGSITKPPALFEESFTVGATNQRDTITAFSSIGPVVIDSSFRIKPNVVAPGRGVRSSVINNEFASFSGTSMSGPHVTGLVALIINANPSLAGQVETIENIIIESAVTLRDSSICFDVSGTEIPNNTYGYGRVDALKAVELARSLISSVEEIKIDFKIFPNPTQNKIYLKFEKTVKVKGIEIYDAMGNRVLRPNDLEREIDTAQLPSGIYYIKIESQSDFAVKSFIKI